MYCKILSGAPDGIDAYLVGVEVDVASGLPMFNMVGSVGIGVRESRERVSVALKNVGIHLPVSHVTVNFSPADIRKEGTGFDLAIAVGLLKNMKYFESSSCKDVLFLGELGLGGEIRKVRGVLPVVRMAAKMGIRKCIIPRANLMEGAVVPDVCVMGAENIVEVINYLKSPFENSLISEKVDPELLLSNAEGECEEDFSEITGQDTAKRAATIAAAGFHNLLMTGPPGAGKSMIAKCIPGILPPLGLDESLEITSVKSVAGCLGEGEALVTKRPFQSPHHSITQAAFTGGGAFPHPGIMSLAHRGVLFMDELPEFGRNVIDSMRQPLEEKRIQIVRINGNIAYPAEFMLVCAMNPCPCGYYPDYNRCRCTENAIRRYMGKVSGPILDRIDLCVELKPVELSCVRKMKKGEGSSAIREKVVRAREIQKERFEGTEYRFNADIKGKDVEVFCPLGEEERKCMEKIYKKFGLSMRTYQRILKVSRTIADLAGEKEINAAHLLEAAAFRPASEYWK